jgi:hypothetical protein
VSRISTFGQRLSAEPARQSDVAWMSVDPRCQ